MCSYFLVLLVLYELQLSYGRFGKGSQESITIKMKACTSFSMS